MGICSSKNDCCDWCDICLTDKYIIFEKYNEQLFRFCSLKCYSKAFKNISNKDCKLIKVN